jgi:hypothetical protein
LEDKMGKTENNNVEDAVERNDEEWQKRMLLLILTMIIAFLSLD